MISRALLVACVGPLVASVVACSSSTSPDPYAEIGGVRACGGTVKMATACDVCIVDACRAELQAASGTDPSRFGGACEANDSCMCTCAREGTKTESECQSSCQSTLTQECGSARAAALRCGFALVGTGGACVSVCAR